MLKRIIDFLRDLFVIRRKAEVQETVEEIVEEFTDLADKTKAELTATARELGLRGYSSLNKADLIALIETSEVL